MKTLTVPSDWFPTEYPFASFTMVKAKLARQKVEGFTIDMPLGTQYFVVLESKEDREYELTTGGNLKITMVIAFRHVGVWADANDALISRQQGGYMPFEMFDIDMGSAIKVTPPTQ